jgi:hypothetical protein
VLLFVRIVFRSIGGDPIDTMAAAATRVAAVVQGFPSIRNMLHLTAHPPGTWHSRNAPSDP